MYNVLVKPLITEKSMSDANAGKFTFVVAKTAEKAGIKKAVEKQFDVHVIAVSTNIVKGKSKRAGTRRMIVREQPWKKAVVQLVKGEKIAIFDISKG